jgi:hypothetical protein
MVLIVGDHFGDGSGTISATINVRSCAWVTVDTRTWTSFSLIFT